MITKVELKKNSSVLDTVSYAYNASNELTRVTDTNSDTVSYAYASNATFPSSRMITKITDRMGREVNFGWTFTDAQGVAEAYKIDMTDPGGLKTTFERSASTGVCSVSTWDGLTMLSKFLNTPVVGDAARSRYKDYYLDATTYERWSYEYNGAGNLTRVLRPGNVVHATYTYTANGRVSTVAGNDGAPVTWHYAAGGLHPTRVTNQAGLETSYYYDGYNRLTRVTPPWSGGADITYAYDANGLLTGVTNPLGHTGTLAYDSLGRLTSRKDPLNNEVKLEYDDEGHVTKATDPRNKSTYFYYAASGCGCGPGGALTKVKDALNHETTLAYDDNGNRTKVTDAAGVATDFFYDAMNRITKVQMPSGTGPYTTLAYDKLGQVTASTDLSGRSTTHAYDHVGRTTSVTDPVGSVTYGFDSAGNLSTVTDGASQTTDYDYDGDNRLTKVNYAHGKATRYLYDAAGRVTKAGAGATGGTDPTEYFYSGTTGFVTRTRFTSGANTADADYAYDAAGRVTQLSDWYGGASSLRYAYDNAGRLTRLTDYDNSTLDYAYDAAGNVTSMTDYHGSVFTYTYTDTDRLSTLTAPGSRTWDYDYNVLGQPTRVDIPNGMHTAYGYDGRHRLTTLEHKDGSTVLEGFAYGLDDGGDITRTTHADGAYWDYSYDGRSRLTKAERKDSGGSLLTRWTYTYSAADNLTTKEVYTPPSTPETCVFAYNAGNELTKQSLGGTDTTFAYDAWGNLTSQTDGTSTANYSWHYGGKLTRVASSFPGEGTVRYGYGGDGKRRERDDGTVTKYRWDARDHVLAEEDSSGVLNLTYVHDPARVMGPILAEVRGNSAGGGSYRYYSQDILGSARQLRDDTRTSLGVYEYDPYGNVIAGSGESISHMFTGHAWDSTSNVYYTLFRFYNPKTTAWLGRDPKGVAVGLNPYLYARANPSSYADPDGQVPILLVVVVVLLLVPPIPGHQAIGYRHVPPPERGGSYQSVEWYAQRYTELLVGALDEGGLIGPALAAADPSVHRLVIITMLRDKWVTEECYEQGESRKDICVRLSALAKKLDFDLPGDITQEERQQLAHSIQVDTRYNSTFWSLIIRRKAEKALAFAGD